MRLVPFHIFEFVEKKHQPLQLVAFVKSYGGALILEVLNLLLHQQGLNEFFLTQKHSVI